MSKGPFVWVGVLVVLVGAAVAMAMAQADELRVCVNPAGQMRLLGAGEACRLQERLVVWNVQGDTGDAGAGVLGVVEDATGAVVGPATTHYEVVLDTPHGRIVVRVTRSGFSNQAVLYYESPDCSGTPYINGWVPPQVPLLDLATVGFDQKLVYRDLNLPVETRVLASRMYPVWSSSTNTWNASPCETFTPYSNSRMTPAQFLDVSNFVPPFRLR